MTKQQIIRKINILPEDILKEVGDFIDFLEIKKRKQQDNWDWLKKKNDEIKEDHLNDYLDGLLNYEEMLAKGEIKWK